MTSKILTGHYSSGYSLNAPFSAVTLTSSAYVGGHGLLVFTTAKVVNAGHIYGGNVGGYGSNGYHGVYMAYGSPLTNSGVILGGYARSGASGNAPGAGGHGGVAIGVRGYGGVATVITNTYDIFGGSGGNGGANDSGTAITGGAGGAGGAAVSINGYGAVTNSVTNSYDIIGGSGGGGGWGGSKGTAGAGGAGGAGVIIQGASKVVATAGVIRGGIGGGAGSNIQGMDYVAGGAGGDGVSLTGGPGLVVSGGTVAGGEGGTHYGPGGSGGVGAYVDGGSVTITAGAIYGGAGGEGGPVYGVGGSESGGAGGAAILLNGAGGHVAQSGGMIVGGAGGSGPVFGNSVYSDDGHGGVGVLAFDTATISQTSGTIQGGAGGAYDNAVGGGGGVGVYLGEGGRIVCAGEILGGAGGYGDTYGGSGGSGVETRLGGTVTNTGTILGGAGGAAPSSRATAGNGVVLSYDGGTVINGSTSVGTALIEGSAGVAIDPYAIAASTVTNFGTIGGTGGFSVYFGFDGAAGDRLIAEAGSGWIGAVAGGGATLELAGGTGTMAGLGGDASLFGSIAMDFSGFGAYQIDAGTSWTFIGSDTLGGGATFTDKGKLANTGELNLAGTVTGSGSFTISGGTATIDAGAKVTVATWSLTGGTTSVDGTLAYAGSFSEGASATLSLGSGDKLTLSGAATLAGLADGAGTLAVLNATLKSLTVGGTTILSVTGAANQTGKITVGDASANAASFSIAKGAVLTISTASDIDEGASSGSSLKVLGTVIRSGASGTTMVQPATTDSGLIEAEAGTLDFVGALSGKGALTIGTGSTLEVDSTAASTLTLTFTGNSAVLALKDPSAFGASIADFTPGNDIDLLKIKATSAVLGAGDTLVITNGATAVATLQLSGSYTGDSFGVVSDGHGGSLITVSGPGVHPPAAGAPGSVLPFVAAMASVAAHRPTVSAPAAHAWGTPASVMVAPRIQMA